jgi:adenosylmethionine-8-amino-7-oxononanoate aminotransferase
VMGQPEKKIMIGRWNGYHGSTWPRRRWAA